MREVCFSAKQLLALGFQAIGANKIGRGDFFLPRLGFRARPLPLLDKLAHLLDLFGGMPLIHVGLKESALQLRALGPCNLDSKGRRNDAALDGTKKSLLTVLEKEDYGADLLRREVELGGNFRHPIMFGQAPNFSQEFYRRMSAARDIFDEAHQEAVFDCGIDQKARNICLPERCECIQSALTANQVIRRCFFPLAHGYRPLEPERAHASDELLEPSQVAFARIQHFDRRYWYAYDCTATLHETPPRPTQRRQNSSRPSKRQACRRTLFDSRTGLSADCVNAGVGNR